MRKVELSAALPLAPNRRRPKSRQNFIMRPLTEEETKMVFEKLYKFIGKVGENMKIWHIGMRVRKWREASEI